MILVSLRHLCDERARHTSPLPALPCWHIWRIPLVAAMWRPADCPFVQKWPFQVTNPENPNRSSKNPNPRHVSSPHLSSRHLTSPHLSSPQLTSAHLSSPQLTSPHLTSPHVTSRHSHSHTPFLEGIHTGGRRFAPPPCVDSFTDGCVAVAMT